MMVMISRVANTATHKPISPIRPSIVYSVTFASSVCITTATTQLTTTITITTTIIIII